MVNGLVETAHSLHFGSSSGFLRMLCCYQFVGRLWSWAAMIEPSVSALRPAAFSHLWVLSWSSLFHPLWVFAVKRFWLPIEPEQLATLVFGLGLCSAGIGCVRLILGRWYCRQSQFPIELHWLSADGVQGFPVVRVFDNVEEGWGIYQDRSWSSCSKAHLFKEGFVDEELVFKAIAPAAASFLHFAIGSSCCFRERWRPSSSSLLLLLLLLLL